MEVERNAVPRRKARIVAIVIFANETKMRIVGESHPPISQCSTQILSRRPGVFPFLSENKQLKFSFVDRSKVR